MFRSSSSQKLNNQQKALHKAWLQESLLDHQQKMAREQKLKEEETKAEVTKIKDLVNEGLSYNRYVKEAKDRQKEIMNQVNKSMIEQREVSRNKYLLEMKNPWGDNIFFENMWKEKNVI